MALTYVFLTNPSAQAVAAAPGSGKSYVANAAGFITGVAPADAIFLQGVNAPLQLLFGTGATTDRPAATVGTALTGALNAINPPATIGDRFWDTTLSALAIFVGTQRASTGWVDRNGAAV